MTKFYYLSIISIFFIGCSSSATVETNVKINVNSNKPEMAAVNAVNTNVKVRPDANFQIQNMTVSKRNVRNWEGKRDGNKNAAPIQAKPMSYPAPDNSEITSTMNNKVPIETRTFKNNPMLVKVERIFVKDVKHPQIKVYLKDGKVLEVPSGRIENSATASANEILSAVGLVLKPALPVNSEKTKQ